MSIPADFDTHTPFDVQFDADTNASVATTQSDTASGLAPSSAAASTSASGFPPIGAKAQWNAFSRQKLLPVLRRERQLSQAMQLAMAAIGGALLVVVTSTVMGVVIPRPDTPTVANNQHPLVTVEDLTANAITGTQGNTIRDANALGADGTHVTMPDAPLDSDAERATDTPNADESSDGGNGSATSEGSLTALSSNPERERRQARREQDRIANEQHRLEDRKRAIERQIEDKQLEERRRQEDQSLAEGRIAEHQKMLDDRHSEDDRLSAEAKQREGQHNDDPKFAQVP